MQRCSIACPFDLTEIASALPEQYPYLLDSAAPGPLGQYSMLLRFNGQQLVLHADKSIDGPGQGHGFLSRLDEWYRSEHKPQQKPIQGRPFGGGWFLYLGYELTAEIEPTVNFPPSDDGFPVAFASRCPGVVYQIPGQQGVLHLLAETESLLIRMREEIANLTARQEVAPGPLSTIKAAPPAEFKQAVERIHEYILDGDVFQVNLSRQWRGCFNGVVDKGSLYRSLRQCNPAPFAGLVQYGDDALMSSSPERLVSIRGNVVQSRPIAGTYPRGGDVVSDRQLRQELLAHPKERAEHIMLIDLERNDLGRVCKPGSVEVDELMVVETYEHVHHIVSNVRGELCEGITPIDVIRAVFPGGTITGCPKVRCMEIIAELEQKGRGFYTGSFGYLGVDGGMDLNILIRSMLLQQSQISFRTGAGIVVDSNPENEVTETENKALGLLRALGQYDA